MPRLFIAVDLPEEHNATLAGLRDATLPARWTPPAQYHLTLRFIGEVHEDRLPSIEQALAAIRAEAFSLRGNGLGVFPSMRKPRILFAALDATPALLALQMEIEHTLRTLGFAAEPKPFRPHVTLARFKRVPARAVRAYVNSRKTVTLDPFIVLHYHLYESALHPEGAVHTRRVTFSLTPPSQDAPRKSMGV